MDIEEVIKWLKIMKANLNTFPEINCGKKIEALAEAIRLLKKVNQGLTEVNQDLNKSEISTGSDDCISREQALDLLCKKCPVYNCIGKCTSYKAIDKMPSVTPQEPRWIPVSEKLPEKNIEVLITTEWDCITIGEMFSNNDWFIHEGATTTNIDDIKAWMPLPEPYKTEMEVRKNADSN